MPLRSFRVAIAVFALSGALVAALCTTAGAATPTRSFEPSLSPLEIDALKATEQGQYVRARTLAEQILRRDPTSVAGEFVLGIALQEGEGNVPLALRHYEQAFARLALPDGRPRPGQEAWHMRLLLRRITALSDLGRYEDLLDAAHLYRDVHAPGFYRFDVWPLMKLGRIEEARAAVARVLADGDDFDETVARNVLCALDGYTACQEMLRAVKSSNVGMGLALRNVGVAAIDAGRYADAERLLLESTEYPEESSNPWRDLAALYARQGRLGEAAQAGRRMFELAHAMPLRQQQHSNAGYLVTAAQLLLLSGYPERAIAASDRAMDTPDRASHWSGSAAELLAEGELLDRAIHRALAEREAEAAAVLPWYRRAVHSFRAVTHRVQGWFSGRRVQPLLQQGGMRPPDLAQPLRPELSAPGWLLPDAVELFGAGPTLALIDDARRAPRRADDPVPAELAEALRLALETEAHWLRGDEESCLRSGARARELVPAAEAMLRARIALRMADSALALGRENEAWPLYDDVLQRDPGLFTRLGRSLPIAPPAPVAGLVGEALERAAASVRFTLRPGSPYRLGAQGEQLCLFGPSGTVLVCAGDPGHRAGIARVLDSAMRDDAVPAPPDPRDLEDPPARIALHLVRSAFAPRLDLSQQDLSTLDGTPIAERGLDTTAIDGLMR